MNEPSVFQSTKFPDALVRAEAKGIWLIVNASSKSSAPCETMTKTSWRNEQVVAWVEERAIAIHVDIDVEGDLAKTLEVSAVPTLIAFRAGEERDRVVGFRDGVELLMWLGSLERGKTALDRARGASLDPERDMFGRLSFAQALLRDHRYDDATEHYAWLWKNITIIEPDMSGVRVSFMAKEIKSLVGIHPPARRLFAIIRNETGAAADSDSGSGRLRLDWVVLNRILRDEAHTMNWFDRVKGDLSAVSVIESVSVFLVEPLKSRGLWADLGRLYRNPMAELAQKHAIAISSGPGMPEALGGEAFAQVREVAMARFRAAAVVIFASLRAAGRVDEAKAIWEEALRLDPSKEMRSALEQAPVRYN